jgi:hypothetical protein
MRPSVAAAWPAVCSRFEGRCWWMYLDTKFLVTTGLGILLETVEEAQSFLWLRVSDGQPATMEEIATEYRRVKALRSLADNGGSAYKASARLRLPEETIDDQLRLTTARFWAEFKEVHPDIDLWPADAQLAATDLMWQNGPKFTTKKEPDGSFTWKNMRAAFHAEDWTRAAANVPGTHPRAQFRKRLFTNAAKVKQLGIDPDILWDTKTPEAPPPPPTSDVGDWMVNPDKVTTHLRGRDKAGAIVTELKPGTVITDGVVFGPNWLGRIALWTAAGVSYDREFLTQVAPGPVPVPETPTRPLPVIPEYDGTERLAFRGRRVCICVATSLPFVEHRMLEEGVIRFNIDIYQGGYNTTVTASAGTHDEGGNTDVGQYSFAALKIWREMGWAMQHRTRAQGFSGDHGHGWPVGCPHLSEGAEWQASEWNLYRNGLRSRGRVTGPAPTGKLTPTWIDGLMAYKARFVSTSAAGLPMPENFDDGTDPKEQA